MAAMARFHVSPSSPGVGHIGFAGASDQARP